jgi:hypothetical protein
MRELTKLDHLIRAATWQCLIEQTLNNEPVNSKTHRAWLRVIDGMFRRVGNEISQARLKGASTEQLRAVEGRRNYLRGRLDACRR